MSLPRWVPLLLGVAAFAWAVSIWWMVATMPSGGDERVSADLALVGNEVGVLVAKVEGLSQYVADLEGQRAALAARVEELESRAQPIADAAAVPPDEGAADDVAEEAAPEPDPSASPWFTAGKDKYNCRDFPTYAAAQEALQVNGPGDPNRIDTNKNGVACEDFAFPDRPRGTPSTAAPSSGGSAGVVQRP